VYTAPITHEAKTNTSLPPSVEGPITGRLRVQLLQIRWDFNIPPPAPRLHVRLKWWGEAGAGTIFKLVKSNPPALNNTEIIVI